MGAPFQRGRFEELPALPSRPHAFARMAAREVQVDSRHFGRIRIHLRELGDGPPLLLVHGLMTSSYSYRYVVEPLAKRFRVVVPDLPGAGRSDKPDARYRASDLDAFLGELLEALSLRGCAAIGNSLGGYLCMRLALRDPGAFSRLMNIHSPAFPEPRLRALGIALRVPGVAAALAAKVRRNPQRWAHANVHYFDEGLKSLEEAEEYGAPLATVEGARAFTRWLRDALDAGELADFVATLEARKARGERFPIPLCLVYSRRDPMVPPRIGEKLHALLPEAEMHWLEESSHFAHVDTPEPLVEIASRFFP